MAPPSSGLIVSKLAVQATASDQLVTGLLCLKLSLPQSVESRHRFPLFSSQTPRLLSQPILQPLPLSISAARNPLVAEAASLLSLASPSAYPPSFPVHLVTPSVEVGRDGQVQIVCEPPPGRPARRRGSEAASSRAGDGRREWLMVMEFEVEVEDMTGRNSWRTLLPLPKCLDNIIRFQVLPPSASSSSSSSAEVSILTEPKMLALPAGSFAASKRKRHQRQHSGARRRETLRAGRVGNEEGWEDGEVMGPDDDEDVTDGESADEDGEDSEGEEGSWLEGRFQSTDTLRLEWSFSPAPSSTPALTITPHWHPTAPSIHVLYEASLANPPSSLYTLEAVLPAGWVWSDIGVSAPGLVSWQCDDDDRLSAFILRQDTDDPDRTAEVVEEDSFSTVRAKQRSTPSARASTGSPSTNGRGGYLPTPASSVSLLRQPLPAQLDHTLEDFSFEVHADAASSSRAMTPVSTPSARRTPSPRPPTTPLTSSQGATSYGTTLRCTTREGVAGRIFELFFASSGERQQDGSIVFEGTLVPDRWTLTSPDIPVAIPFLRSLEGGIETDEQCAVTCPQADLRELDDHGLVRSMTDVIGMFRWEAPAMPLGAIKGKVRVLYTLAPGDDGLDVKIVFPCPRSARQLGFVLPLADVSGAGVRVKYARVGGRAVRRSLHRGDGGWQVRVEGGVGEAQVGLAVMDWESGELPLPVFDDEATEGEMVVELKGDGWENHRTSTNLERQLDRPRQFSTPLPPPAASSPLYLSTAPPSAKRPRPRPRAGGLRRLVSVNSLVNLFLLWLVVSVGQQVQRLRAEVGFLREGVGAGIGGEAWMTAAFVEDKALGQSSPREVGRAEVVKLEGESIAGASMATGETALATTTQGLSVIMPGLGWDVWLAHPTVQTLTRGVGWLWHAVVWLIGP